MWGGCLDGDERLLGRLKCAHVHTLGSDHSACNQIHCWCILVAHSVKYKVCVRVCVCVVVGVLTVQQNKYSTRLELRPHKVCTWAYTQVTHVVIVVSEKTLAIQTLYFNFSPSVTAFT